jgi:hypothetical protein
VHAFKIAPWLVIDRDGILLGWQTAPLEDRLEALINYRGKSPTKSSTGIPVLSAKVVETTGQLSNATPDRAQSVNVYRCIWN